MPNDTERAEYVKGLRALADLIEQHDELPLPTSKIEWAVHYFGDDDAQKTALATIARLLPGKVKKNDPNSSEYNAEYFILKGTLHGLRVEAWANRSTVCTRVVTGTREVTKTVPVKTEDVTVVEDVVEWVCEPILAAAVSQ